MKIVTALFITLFSISSYSAELVGNTINFEPDSSTKAQITIKKSSINFVLSNKCATKEASLPLQIESEPKLDVRDFNFDGKLDFSVWYLDEGKGTYTIHRVFIFDTKSFNFNEAKPKCGDEFLNLKLDMVKRALTSTYFKNNRPFVCTTKLPKLGMLNTLNKHP